MKSGRKLSNKSKPKSEAAYYRINRGNFIVFILLVFGLTFLILSKKWPSSWGEAEKIGLDIVYEIGILLLTLAPIHYIYERIMQQHHLNEMGDRFQEILDETGMQMAMRQIAHSVIPDHHKNLFEVGVADGYPKLKAADIIRGMQKGNQNIDFLQMWIPFLEDGIEKRDFIDSIAKGCNFRILILDPDIPPKRIQEAAAVNPLRFSEELCKLEAIKSINFFQDVFKLLPRNEKNGTLSVRLHRGFLPLSLIGFDDHYITGFYLHKTDFSNQHTQLKINKETDAGTRFYNELNEEFEYQWRSAFYQVKLQSPHKYETITINDPKWSIWTGRSE